MFKEIRLRTTSKVTGKDFPWLDDMTPFIILSDQRSLISQAKTQPQKLLAMQDLRENDIVLAAWPGKYSQDVFLVDDLDEPKRALGMLPNTRTFRLDNITPGLQVYVDGKITWVDAVTKRRNGVTQITLTNGRTFHSNSTTSMQVVTDGTGWII